MGKSPFSRLNPFSKDRNDQALNGVARAQFAHHVAQGHVGPLDRFGRKVEVGSLVMWHPPQDTVWEVTKVDAVLDPNAAPGLVRIELHAMGAFNALANNVLPILVWCGERPKPAPEPAEPPTADAIEQHRRIADGLAPPDPRD